MFLRYLINPKNATKIYDWCDCIIIGSGIAGLSTAIRISKQFNVKVLTKSNLSESTTWYAQGGIAAAIKKPDWWKVHYDDTIEAGQGLCDSKAVKKLVRNAPKMIEDLIEFGINFDISGGEISLTTEGGHSHPRVLHAGGDATGEEVEKKLVKFSKNFTSIQFFPEYLVIDILTFNSKVIGLIALNLKKNILEIHPASNIVIASGGIGQIYEVSTNPPISTGDGIAMAFRAGASIKDIEFIQFHPTVFKTKDGHLFLITEALRGEGAYLRDKNGKRFMLGKHPKAELAPRDVVVREMVKVMNEQNIDYVFLDATHIPEKKLKIRFPNIILKLKENGLNLFTDLIKIFPAAHYLNGGIKTDLKGKTDIVGLYACGETAATGAHGANRLASNSLIEGLVYGWEISKDIINKCSKKSSQSAQNSKKFNRYFKKLLEDIPTTSILTDNKSSLNLDFIENLDEQISEFKKIMSKNVGILRDKNSLDLAEKYIIKKLKEINYNISHYNISKINDIKKNDKIKSIDNININNIDIEDNIDDNIKGKNTDILKILNKNNKNNSILKNLLEFINMLTVGYLITKAAKTRTESRGTHLRNDFPNRDDKNWKKHIILKNDLVMYESVT